jgi:hypothetical protein
MKVQADPKPSYAPNDAVPVSGVYRVRHYRHRLPHEATLLKGESFPHCRFCVEKVRFRLIQAATRVEHDNDFLEPETSLAK